MAFEGVEKKVEILLCSGADSLRARGEEYWRHIVNISQAEILSSISSEHCDAYLLSESSLFVFSDRVIMITCGQTRLIRSVERMVEDVGSDHLESLIYERKNELYPGKQPTTFSHDVDRLARILPGESHVFGDPETHHLSLFHLNRPFTPELEDNTTELLMYDLDPSVRENFQPGATDCVHALGLRQLFPEFAWDDHLFEPAGYSLNGLRGDWYLTVHITPDVPGSYASLETNALLSEARLQAMAGSVLGALKPKRFDLIQFQETPTPLEGLSSSVGTLQDADSRRLGCGYALHFFHYRRSREENES